MKRTADTITDEEIRTLRRDTLAQWAERGRRTKWPEGSEILSETLVALMTVPGKGVVRARARLAEILNAREAQS